MKYAQIDITTGRCVSISFLSGEVIADDMKLITDTDNVNHGDTWDSTSGTWTPKPIPIKTLDEHKQDKIDLLSSVCNKTILAGFTSSATGISHQYDFNEEWQRNLSGRLGVITSNPNYPTTFKWKTKDAGLVDHTKAQFIQLCTDADIFKDTMAGKYWVKVTQASQCTTQAERDSIQFPKNLNPPNIPTGLTGTAGTGQASLSWTANTDVTMISGGGYNIYQDGVKINTNLVTTASFVITGLATGTSYQFTISAVDTDGNESAQTATIVVKPT